MFYILGMSQFCCNGSALKAVSADYPDQFWGLFDQTYGWLQGKYINDAQILREIAREAQLEDPDRVADDPSCCAKEVRWLSEKI